MALMIAGAAGDGLARLREMFEGEI